MLRFASFLVIIHLYLSTFVSGKIYECDRNATCGCSKNNAVVNKIVGGEDTVTASWGWTVSLQNPLGSSFCTGAIISPSFIITAAHCVPNMADVIRNTKVVVGIDRLTESGQAKAQVRTVLGVFSHPQYNANNQVNDIAILRLNQSLTISAERETARLCLPDVTPNNATTAYPNPNTPLVAIGWGKLATSDVGIPSNLHLQQVTVNSLSTSHYMCVGETTDDRTQFCAAVNGGGKDTCQGDSGGPLMDFEPKSRRWVLAGVTSYGRGDCANSIHAGVYTRVSFYQSWIRSIVTEGVVEASVTAGGASLTHWSLTMFLWQSLIFLGFYISKF